MVVEILQKTRRAALRNIQVRWFTYLVTLLAYFSALALSGAIPFIFLSTLGQSTVVVGYPISFLNGGFWSIYPMNIGYPTASPMSTMLAPALVMKAFLGLGTHPADAFTFALIAWITLGFTGAYAFARTLDIRPELSALLALLWFCFPIVWNSAGYSHLHFGFSLLPFLMFAAYRLFFDERDNAFEWLAPAALYLTSALLAVFTDGYTFILFAVGSSALTVSRLLFYPSGRLDVLRYSAPIHALSFGLAYLLYTAYIGRNEYPPAPIDFFRAWGLDLTFAIQPTRGIHWLWDTLRLSDVRSPREYFGDASVWISTFMLPLWLLTAALGLMTKKWKKLAIPMAMMAAIGIYMAMGPSIKIDVRKPADATLGTMMPVKYATIPTGNAILSENLPGFKNMRASYRWIALAYFGLWGVVVVSIAGSNKHREGTTALYLSIAIVSFLPNLANHFGSKINFRNMFLQIDADLLTPLQTDLKAGEVVAFVPYGNDFLSNYLAPRLKVKAYNVGGDKNVETALPNWPSVLRGLSNRGLSQNFGPKALRMLAEGNADSLILTYVDLKTSAHYWPTKPIYKQDLLLAETYLIESGLAEVSKREFYSVVRLNMAGVAAAKAGQLQKMLPPCAWSACLSADKKTLRQFSQTGEIVGNRLRTNHKPGFLFFGPYAEFLPGRYRLSLRGDFPEAKGARLDVASTKQATKYLDLDLDAFLAEGGNPEEIEFTVSDPVDDMEVRLLVGPDTDIAVKSYEIMPFDMPRNREARSEKASLAELPIACQCTDRKVQIRRSGFVKGTTPSQTGEIFNGTISTNGRPGYVLFGPYAPLKSGHYCLAVSAEVDETDGAYVDVAAQGGNIVFTRAPLVNTEEVQTFLVPLDRDVSDAEIRVYAGQESSFELMSATLSEACD